MSSFGKATRGNSLTKASQLPGPGNYNGNGLKLNPSYSIGKAGRSQSKPSDMPGPGQYQVNGGKQKGISMGLKTSYGASIGGFANNGANPGPGQYQSSFDQKGPQYTFGHKTGSALDSSKLAGVPGPGSYNLGATALTVSTKYNPNQSRGAAFGTEKRSVGGVTKSMSDLPGPGMYTIDQSSGKGPKIGFGTSKRDKKTGTLYVPGPGQYSLDDNFGRAGPKVSMKFRPNTSGGNRTIDAPGPGQYNPNLSTVKQQTAAPKIGTSKRDGFNPKDAASVPGPGHFTLSDDWTNKKKNPGFGSSKRYNVGGSKEGPGPGNYTVNERAALTSAPSYSMFGGGARSNSGKNQLPGPGQYNPKVDYAKENLGGVKIGTSPRGNKYQSDVPGPGNYNVSGRIGGPAFGIGSGSRTQLKSDQTPGPGHYKLPYYVAEVPRYVMPDKPESLRYV